MYTCTDGQYTNWYNLDRLWKGFPWPARPYNIWIPVYLNTFKYMDGTGVSYCLRGLVVRPALLIVIFCSPPISYGKNDNNRPIIIYPDNPNNWREVHESTAHHIDVSLESISSSSVSVEPSMHANINGLGMGRPNSSQSLENWDENYRKLPWNRHKLGLNS